jgi:hypothetical protein
LITITMHFSASSLVAFAVLFSAIHAAPNANPIANPIAEPAAQTAKADPPATTKASTIKHIAYKCAAGANVNRCADAKKILFAKELKGCDVLGKSRYSTAASFYYSHLLACAIASTAGAVACVAAAMELGLGKSTLCQGCSIVCLLTKQTLFWTWPVSRDRRELLALARDAIKPRKP